MLRIPLDLSFNTGYKDDKFFKTLLRKDFKFVLNKKNDIIAFNLGFMLLLAKDVLISEK